jgi:hypothetical protein
MKNKNHYQSRGRSRVVHFCVSTWSDGRMACGLEARNGTHATKARDFSKKKMCKRCLAALEKARGEP